MVPYFWTAPRSYGLAVMVHGEYMIDNLVKMNEEIPVTTERTYYTMTDAPDRAHLRVFESMSSAAYTRPDTDADGHAQDTDPTEQVRYLGAVEIDLMEGTPKGTPVEVTFEVQAQYIFVKTVNTFNGTITEAMFRLQPENESGREEQKLIKALGASDSDAPPELYIPDLPYATWMSPAESGRPVYGIHLGADEISMAVADNDRVEVIPNPDDATDTLRTEVCFESENDVVVGAIAKEMRWMEGERVIRYAPHALGQWDARYPVQDRTYTPADVCAFLLKRLTDIAAEQGHHVQEAVLTCPPYHDIHGKEQLMAAVCAAGLEDVRIVPTPIAVAAAYVGTQPQPALPKHVLVYDMSEVALDVAMLRLDTENAGGEARLQSRILEIDGNDRLDAADWDERLFQHLLTICEEETGMDVADIDEESQMCIREQSERVRMRLNHAERAKARVMVNGVPVRAEVTRAEFEQMTEDLVGRAMSYLEPVLERAGVQPDMVLLAGSAVQMPMIQNALKARFPGLVQCTDPQTAAARGAARCGSILLEQPPAEPDFIFAQEPAPKEFIPAQEPAPEARYCPVGAPLSLTPPEPPVAQATHSYGVAVRRNGQYRIWNLIKRGEPLPVKIVQHYVTVCKGQEKIVVRLFEDDSTADEVLLMCDAQNRWCGVHDAGVRHLGDLELHFAPDIEPGESVIVELRLTEDGFRAGVGQAPQGMRPEFRFAP